MQKYELVCGSGGYPKKAGARIRVETINARNPTHQAPTHRGSCSCNVILQRKHAPDEAVGLHLSLLVGLRASASGIVIVSCALTDYNK